MAHVARESGYSMLGNDMEFIQWVFKNGTYICFKTHLGHFSILSNGSSVQRINCYSMGLFIDPLYNVPPLAVIDAVVQWDPG